MYQYCLANYESTQVVVFSHYSRQKFTGTAKEIYERYSVNTLQRYDILTIQTKKGVTKITTREN